MSNLNQAEMLEEGIKAVISKAEQIDQVCNDVNSLKDVVKSLTDVVKNNTELMTNTTTKLTDFTLEQAKKADELQQKALKKSHNKLSDVYANLSDVSANVENHPTTLTNNTFEDFVKSAGETCGTNKEVTLNKMHSEEIAQHTLHAITKFAPRYTSDNNSLGGYALLPQILPTTEITPYTNESILVDMINMGMVGSNLTTFTNRIDYKFNEQIDQFKEVAEGSAYLYNDNASQIYYPMQVNMHAVKKHFTMSLKLMDNNPTLYNFLVNRLSQDFKLAIARSVVKTINNFKSIKSVEAEIQAVLNNHIVTTQTAGQINFSDLTDKIFEPETLLLENFVRPVMLLNSKMLNTLYQHETSLGYPRDLRINTTTKTIKTVWGDMPYVLFNNNTLFARQTTIASGTTAAILMDTSDAYELLGTSMGARTTISHEHIQNEEEQVKVLQTIYVGGAITNPYKISILKVQ